MHPAHENVAVVIEHRLNVHERHMVDSGPVLKLSGEHGMDEEMQFSRFNGPFLFEFVPYQLDLLRVGDRVYLLFLDQMGLRLLLEGNQDDPSSLTLPIEFVDIGHEVFARAHQMPFNLSLVECRLSDHVLSNAVEKRDHDKVVTHGPLGNLDQRRL